jgi:hypothetical protein
MSPLDTARARFQARFGYAPHSGMNAGLRRTWHAMLCREIGVRPSSRVPRHY